MTTPHLLIQLLTPRNHLGAQEGERAVCTSLHAGINLGNKEVPVVQADLEHLLQLPRGSQGFDHKVLSSCQLKDAVDLW